MVLSVHVCAKNRQLSVHVAKCCQYRQILSLGEYTRRPALSLCMCSAVWSIGCEVASRGPSALADITCLVAWINRRVTNWFCICVGGLFVFVFDVRGGIRGNRKLEEIKRNGKRLETIIYC